MLTTVLTVGPTPLLPPPEAALVISTCTKATPHWLATYFLLLICPLTPSAVGDGSYCATKIGFPCDLQRTATT